MQAEEIIERLITENPPFHNLSAENVQAIWNSPVASQIYSNLAVNVGPVSWACSTAVLRYLSQSVKNNFITLETGAGQSTIVFAALSCHHFCITPDLAEIELIKRYMDRVGISSSKVTFLAESSDVALPKFDMGQELDFAFVDGCHGYPFPALDWHYIDLRMKLGGTIGFDNTELRAVRSHCEFLEQNQAYRLVDHLDDGYTGTSFYQKIRHEEREWIFQRYNVHSDKDSQHRLSWMRRLIGYLRRVTNGILHSGI